MPATGSPTRNSPTRSGKGTGSGATQEEATRAALRTACSQLGVSGEAKTRCEGGQDFDVRSTVGGVTLISAVDVRAVRDELKARKRRQIVSEPARGTARTRWAVRWPAACT